MTKQKSPGACGTGAGLLSKADPGKTVAIAGRIVNPQPARAAHLLVRLIAAEARARRRHRREAATGLLERQFLAAADGVDRSKIVRRAAVRLLTVLPINSIENTEAALWRVLEQKFGWVDLASAEPRGTA